MGYTLLLTKEAESQLEVLATNPGLLKRFKAVKKALRFLAQGPRHPGLHTHEFTSLTRQYGKKIFEAYAENHTPGAYRIFWFYGEPPQTITVVLITPHP